MIQHCKIKWSSIIFKIPLNSLVIVIIKSHWCHTDTVFCNHKIKWSTATSTSLSIYCSQSFYHISLVLYTNISIIQRVIFWDVTLCILVEGQCFGGTYSSIFRKKKPFKQPARKHQISGELPPNYMAFHLRRLYSFIVITFKTLNPIITL